MFGGLNLLQSSALTMTSQPSFPQPTHIFDINVPERPEDVPLKFKPTSSFGMMGAFGGLGGGNALPMFLPNSPMPGQTVIATTAYINQFPPRNCIEAISRRLCPARQSLAGST